MKGNILSSDDTANWSSDLREAHQCENELKSIFESNYSSTVTTSQELGSFSNYDLKVELHDQSKTFTIEVKQDKKAAITNNVAVEFQRTLKDGTVRPTCISISQADIWAYKVQGTFWLIPTEDLRQLISDKKYSRIVDNAGDGDRASCYLFSLETFKKYFTDIKTFLK